MCGILRDAKYIVLGGVCLFVRLCSCLSLFELKGKCDGSWQCLLALCHLFFVPSWLWWSWSSFMMLILMLLGCGGSGWDGFGWEGLGWVRMHGIFFL